MRETGRIISIEGNKAIIEMEFKGGCESCAMNSMCRSSGTGKRELSLTVVNKNYQSGQWVEIETEPRSLVVSALIIFIFPVLLSSAAYFILFDLTKKNSIGLAGFFGFFVISEFLILFIDKKFGRGKFFEPRLIRTVDDHPQSGRL